MDTSTCLMCVWPDCSKSKVAVAGGSGKSAATGDVTVMAANTSSSFRSLKRELSVGRAADAIDTNPARLQRTVRSAKANRSEALIQAVVAEVVQVQQSVRQGHSCRDDLQRWLD
jgi:hypothetical protein